MAICIPIHTAITAPVDVTFDLYSVIITTVFKMARAVSGYLMGIQKLLIEDRQCHNRRKKDNKMSSLNENRGQIQVLRKDMQFWFH